MNLVLRSAVGALALLASLAPPAKAAELSWADCGDGPACARLTVPADWARPAQAKITVGLAKLPAKNQATSKGVLLVKTGGPGAQIRILRQAKATFEDLTTWFDVAIFDPRGFGTSSGITCPTPAPFTYEWVFPDRAAFDAYAAKNRAFGETCGKEAGPLSGRLTSWQAAHDMDAIRRALGESRLTYFGNSHGTALAQAYVELFPGKVGRMYLDSVIDHTTISLRDWLKRRAKALEGNFHRFAGWCERTSTCALHGKDVEAVWDEVLATARREPIPAGPGVTVTDTQIVSRSGFAYQEMWERMATGISQAQAGDATFFTKVEGLPDPDLSRIFICAEFPYPGSRYLNATGDHALYLSGNTCVREHVHRYLTTGALPPVGASC
ncbi:alpha/beta fold hydrolase [Nonomuraea sp. NPDC050643]|uniref:alpha/beta fold hydrolase n=1 Tax=Nonomuraea sp. NPDC050643 TaxID=3155660 RepID=UPI0033D76A33